MLTIHNLVQPETVQEAFEILNQRKSNTIVGGCAFLRMSSKKINTAIELTKLGLNYISEDIDYIEIGAMATFRDIETNDALKNYFNGLVPKAIGNIIGVQFRNVVTAGATVYSRYGFSDFITALLALETEVELYSMGRISLEEFLRMPYKRDILTKIFIKKDNTKAAYKDFRNSSSDYPVLNTAVSYRESDNQWKIVVGARPRGAAFAKKAALELSKGTLTEAEIEAAADLASKELAFGSNMRATEEYRKALCKVLVKRAVMEVLACK